MNQVPDEIIESLRGVTRLGEAELVEAIRVLQLKEATVTDSPESKGGVGLIAVAIAIQKVSLRLKKFSLRPIWSLRWVAKPVGYLLPRDDREEWLGDLEEIHHLMLVEETYPAWIINLVIAIKTLLLVWTAVEVHIVNLFSRNSGA